MASTQSQMLSLEEMTFCSYCVPSVGIIEISLTTKVEDATLTYRPNEFTKTTTAGPQIKIAIFFPSKLTPNQPKYQVLKACKATHPCCTIYLPYAHLILSIELNRTSFSKLFLHCRVVSSKVYYVWHTVTSGKDKWPCTETTKNEPRKLRPCWHNPVQWSS